MLGYKRTDRVGDQIRTEVADILMHKLKDPRLGFVTVTSVNVTPDLKNAWVYVTILQEGEQERVALATLDRATGFIRGELGKRLKLRYVPQLAFRKDESVDRVNRVMNLLEGLHGSGGEAPASGVSKEEKLKDRL